MGESEFQLDWRKVFAAIAVLALLIWVGFRMFAPKPMAIEEGVSYKLISYAIAAAPTTETVDTPSETGLIPAEGEMPSYVLTISYPDGTGHGSIQVPKAALVTDKSLPVNTVVWDRPVKMEGRLYQLARWNPGYSVRARERPLVAPNPKPLER